MGSSPSNSVTSTAEVVTLVFATTISVRARKDTAPLGSTFITTFLLLGSIIERFTVSISKRLSSANVSNAIFKNIS